MAKIHSDDAKARFSRADCERKTSKLKRGKCSPAQLAFRHQELNQKIGRINIKARSPINNDWQDKRFIRHHLPGIESLVRKSLSTIFQFEGISCQY
jgi:hypothetical protein